MVRAFTDRGIPVDQLDRLLDLARRAPSAGNTQAVELVVLDGPGQTGRYWDVTLPAARRESFRWPGLLRAPVLVLPVTRPAAYPDRYAEPDKAATGLRAGVDAWPVPYWWVDGGMAVQTLLLAAVDVGLGACFFGVFDHEAAVRRAFGIPDDRRLLGAVAIGHAAPDADQRPGRSAARPRPPLDQIVHRGAW